MPSFQPTEPWPADPHTLAKIELVRLYFEAWLTIIGRSFSSASILYIDGFAGPGIYSDGEEGSPIAALKAASRAIAIARGNWRAGDVFIELVEKDNDSVRILKDRVSALNLHERVHVSIRYGSFEERLDDIREAHPKAFRDRYPLFAFVDPFGVKGVPFSSIEAILRSTTSEVFVNLDVDGIHRVISDPTPQNRSLLDSLFGDSHWTNEILTGHGSHLDIYRRIWTAYRTRINSLGVRYTYPFIMRGSNDQVLYYLVFASRHKLGMIKMKEAMAKVGQHGTFSVSDALNDRRALFDLDDPSFYLPAIRKQFGGRSSVGINEVEDFILNETQFRSLSKILTPMVNSGLLSKNPPTKAKNVFKGVKTLDFE
jgi:three-Cys-motif partner protein